MSDSSLLLTHFVGRTDHVAVSDDGKTFRPVALKSPLSASELEREHLEQKRCLGFYVMRPDNTVLCSCVDFDNKPERPDPAWKDKAEQLSYLLQNVDLSPVVEVSSSGNAAHVWLFFSEPIEAWLVRAFWRAVAAHGKMKLVEVYPRQERLSGKGLGNLIRYPLWSKSRFVDVESDWATLTAAEAFAGIEKANTGKLKFVGGELGATLKPEVDVNHVDNGSELPTIIKTKIDERHTMLSRRWHGDTTGMADTSKSAMAQAIAYELVRFPIPTARVEQALRVWCELNDCSKGERDAWVAMTVGKAYDLINSKSERKATVGMTMRDAGLAYMQKMADGGVFHIGSGVSQLDASIDGVGFQEMCVLAARPSHGKTAFALQWVDNAAKMLYPCLIISEEMSHMELGKRLIQSVTAGMNPSDWVTNRDKVEQQLSEHYKDRAPVHLIESCGTIERCSEIIDRYCEAYDVKFVAVDYIQLLNSRKDSRYESVTEISQGLKQAAKRNDCALLSLSQLSRGIEHRDYFEPKLSDLRESGSIEQDADLIVFLVWPWKAFAVHDGKPVDPSDYICYCAKRRNGPIRSGVVHTTFDANSQRFGE